MVPTNYVTSTLAQGCVIFMGGAGSGARPGAHRYSWSLRERNWQAPSPLTTRSVRQYSLSRRSSSALPVGSASAGTPAAAAAVAWLGLTWGMSCRHRLETPWREVHSGLCQLASRTNTRPQEQARR